MKRNKMETNRTRKLNPKLGFLGFFGFFGFFFEGKMSDTLMDERFQENKNRAQFMALKISFAVIILALLFLSLGEYFDFMGIEYLYRAVQSLIALSIALAMFLSEYLLYRYDHDEYSADEHIDNSDRGYDKSEDDMKE